jgi:hypothetical protein
MVDIQVILETLIENEFDPEGARYDVLAELQRADESFEENQLFPELAQLVHGVRGLQAVKEDRKRKREAMQNHQDIVDIDWEKGIIQRGDVSGRPFKQKNADYDKEFPQLDSIEKVESVFWLADFAIENMCSLIEFGKAVYESVSDSMEIVTVGVVPSYQAEGYMFVPDLQAGKLTIQRYELGRVGQMDGLQSMVDERGDDEVKFVLKTRRIKTIARSPTMPTLNNLKTNLIENRPDLPNPATFYFEVDKSAPFKSTLLPIAKREFVREQKG